MNELRELYQELIIDHGRHPRHFGCLHNASHIKEGHNPLCGDHLTLYLCEKSGVIEDVAFKGAGCAISIASASLMAEKIIGKTFAEADVLFQAVHQLITLGLQSDSRQQLGKLVVLSGVSEFPSRVKCATLAWHTLQAALHHSEQAVSTEHE